MVRLDIVPFDTELDVWNTRSIPFPSMIVLSGPAPVMLTSSVTSRSPVAAASSPCPAIVSTYVPAGTTIVSGPARAFASWIAARRVHELVAVAHLPSPGVASTASAVLLTVNVAATTGTAPRNNEATARRRLTGDTERNGAFQVPGERTVFIRGASQTCGALSIERGREPRGWLSEAGRSSFALPECCRPSPLGKPTRKWQVYAAASTASGLTGTRMSRS